MFESNEHEEWVNEMLDNPEAKPVFDEFLDVRGKYPPPPLMKFQGKLEEMLAEIKEMTAFLQDAKESITAIELGVKE